MVQAGTQGIYAEVAERDSGGERGRYVWVVVWHPLDTRAHIRTRVHVCAYTRAAWQTSNKSFNKFCGSGGGDGGGGGSGKL